MYHAWCVKRAGKKKGDENKSGNSREINFSSYRRERKERAIGCSLGLRVTSRCLNRSWAHPDRERHKRQSWMIVCVLVRGERERERQRGKKWERERTEESSMRKEVKIKGKPVIEGGRKLPGNRCWRLSWDRYRWWPSSSALRRYHVWIRSQWEYRDTLGGLKCWAISLYFASKQKREMPEEPFQNS